jgi:hypothetical protein
VKTTFAATSENARKFFCSKSFFTAIIFLPGNQGKLFLVGMTIFEESGEPGFSATWKVWKAGRLQSSDTIS